MNMKNFLLTGVFTLIICLFCGFIISAQQQEKGKALTKDVSQIINRSCVTCHSDKGSGMAKMKVNFDKWQSYSDEKQVKLAQKCYQEVSKGGMPPKGFIKSNPGAALSPEEIDIFRNW